MNKTTNNSNIKVIKDTKFKFVNIRVSFMANLEYCDIAAYNLLVRLLTTRTAKYPTIDQFNTYLENQYGMTIRGGYFNRGNVGIFNIISTCMNSKYSLNEDLLSNQVNTIKDCIFNPIINEETLNEVKKVYIQKLKEQSNKKTYILKKKINSILGNDNPYGVNIESDIASIESVSLENIKEVYQKLITSCCKIYICGDIDEKQAKDMLYDERFKYNDESLLNMAYLKEFNKSDINVFESNFLQSAISIIYQCNINYNDELYYALKIFLEMFNYDLFNVIREKYNFCYYIYAISNNYLNTVEIVSEIESKNLDKIISLTDEIIKGYIDNFNIKQFEICKNKIFTYIKNSIDSPYDMIDLHFGFDFNKTVCSLKEFEEKYRDVSIEQVKKVASMLSLKIVSILKEGTNNG